MSEPARRLKISSPRARRRPGATAVHSTFPPLDDRRTEVLAAGRARTWFSNRSAVEALRAAWSAIPPPAQRTMSERIGATVSQTPGSHAVYVSNPAAVANLIIQAAPSAIRETKAVA